jgi:putative DNA primase/helicase
VKVAEARVHLSDRGNAMRLVRRHGRGLRHCHPWRKDLVWDGRRWRMDNTAAAVLWAKETLVDLFAWATARMGDIQKQLTDSMEAI